METENQPWLKSLNLNLILTSNITKYDQIGIFSRLISIYFLEEYQ